MLKRRRITTDRLRKMLVRQDEALRGVLELDVTGSSARRPSPRSTILSPVATLILQVYLNQVPKCISGHAEKEEELLLTVFEKCY